MAHRIVIIDGHPDPAGKRFVHALAERYEKGARAAGHEVTRIIVSALNFHPVRASLVGTIEAMDKDKREEWLDKVEALGRRAR